MDKTRLKSLTIGSDGGEHETEKSLITGSDVTGSDM